MTQKIRLPALSFLIRTDREAKGRGSLVSKREGKSSGLKGHKTKAQGTAIPPGFHK